MNPVQNNIVRLTQPQPQQQNQINTVANVQKLAAILDGAGSTRSTVTQVDVNAILNSVLSGDAQGVRDGITSVVQEVVTANNDALTDENIDEAMKQLLGNPAGSDVTDEDVNLLIDNILSAGGGSDAGVLLTDMVRGVLTGQTGVEGDTSIPGLTTQAITDLVQDQGLNVVFSGLLGMQDEPRYDIMLRARASFVGVNSDEVFFAQGRSNNGENNKRYN